MVHPFTADMSPQNTKTEAATHSKSMAEEAKQAREKRDTRVNGTFLVLKSKRSARVWNVLLIADLLGRLIYFGGLHEGNTADIEILERARERNEIPMEPHERLLGDMHFESCRQVLTKRKTNAKKPMAKSECYYEGVVDYYRNRIEHNATHFNKSHALFHTSARCADATLHVCADACAHLANLEFDTRHDTSKCNQNTRALPKARGVLCQGGAWDFVHRTSPSASPPISTHVPGMIVVIKIFPARRTIAHPATPLGRIDEMRQWGANQARWPQEWLFGENHHGGNFAISGVCGRRRPPCS